VGAGPAREQSSAALLLKTFSVKAPGAGHPVLRLTCGSPGCPLSEKCLRSFFCARRWSLMPLNGTTGPHRLASASSQKLQLRLFAGRARSHTFHPASSIQHPASSIQHPAPSTQHPAPNSQPSEFCPQSRAASSLRRFATAARTCCGAVPPTWLRDCTEPSSVSTANTSCAIIGENCCSS